jgi:hypothetical protein
MGYLRARAVRRADLERQPYRSLWARRVTALTAAHLGGVCSPACVGLAAVAYHQQRRRYSDEIVFLSHKLASVTRRPRSEPARVIRVGLDAWGLLLLFCFTCSTHAEGCEALAGAGYVSTHASCTHVHVRVLCCGMAHVTMCREPSIAARITTPPMPMRRAHPCPC